MAELLQLSHPRKSSFWIQAQLGNAPVVLSDLDTWLENAYPLLSTTYGCGGPEEQFVSTWLLAPKFDTLWYACPARAACLSKTHAYEMYAIWELYACEMYAL
jgi:hypothetical protein